MTHGSYRDLVVALTVLGGLTSVAIGEISAKNPTLSSPSQVAALDMESGRIVISTRQGDRLKPRAVATFESARPLRSYRPFSSGNLPRQGIEVYGAAAEPEFSLLVDDRGVFEFKPGKARKLVLRGLHWRYGMVPALVGTDFLYDPKTAAVADRLHVPALNVLLGLVDGEDCMAVGVWPPGRQSAALELAPGSQGGTVPAAPPASLALRASMAEPSKPESQARDPKLIDGLTFDMAGQSFYFSCLEKPGIWHAEPLKRSYLEKDAVIAWKRPFEAKWIGRFFITSDEYDWPFYFGSKPTKIWGRYIRGWYNYPLRFDGDATVVHFEKQFQPNGELLIYCLEPHPDKPDASVFTPAEVMARALGKAQADKILDPEGSVEQTLLEHRLAVCAMTNTMQKWVNAGQAAEHREQVTRWCHDTAAFIRMIRQRDQAFGAFARDMRAALDARVKERPELAGSAAELQESLAAIQRYSEREVPGVALETVEQWTAEMQKTADDVGPDGRKTFAKLGGQCRSVAGTQDDLARTLSIQVIRLTEQAARLGVQSPQHARLAEEIIVKARQLLRRPTWWEPARRFVPKSDPGNTF